MLYSSTRIVYCVCMSQRQDSSPLHYRGLIRECGFHRAIEIAAKDVDRLREELGRKLDRQAVIRMGFLAIGVVLGVLLCAMKGCTTMGSEPIPGWPQLRIVEHYIPHKDMRDKCAPYVSAGSFAEACAEFHLDAGTCHIWYSADFPPQAWIVKHERMHCAGYQHAGDNSMARHFDRWKKARGL